MSEIYILTHLLVFPTGHIIFCKSKKHVEALIGEWVLGGAKAVNGSC